MYGHGEGGGGVYIVEENLLDDESGHRLGQLTAHLHGLQA